ncbi:MAG: hypothetical protein OEP95_08990 [Myxococcales bacterium]|nr:hypothetical protein [Myxococcales bacterium]
MPAGTALLATVVALALGGWALWRFVGGYPAARGFERLAPREVAFLRAVGDAMYPAGGVPRASGTDARIAEYVDEYLGLVPAQMGVLMRLLFFLVEQATILFPAPGRGGRRRFSALTPEQGAAVLDGWRSSCLPARRLVFTSLRAVLTNCYVADPSVLRDLRLAPFDFETPVLEADLLYPPIGRPPAEIVHGQADLTPPSDGSPLPLDGPLHPAYRAPEAP